MTLFGSKFKVTLMENNIFKIIIIFLFIFLSGCSSESSKIKKAMNDGPACTEGKGMLWDPRNNIASYGEFINIFFKDIETKFFVHKDRFDKNKNRDIVQVKAKFKFGLRHPLDPITIFKPDAEYVFQLTPNPNDKNRWYLAWVGFLNGQNRNSQPKTLLCNFLNIKNTHDNVGIFSSNNLKNGDYLDTIYLNNTRLMFGFLLRDFND